MLKFGIQNGSPALVIAPMEGVTDAPMRAFLSERGGFTFCVSEFLRISQEIPPAWIFREHLPELANSCQTPSGLPVQLQLLGGDPEKLAEAAVRAVQLGVRAIDLNFGCPAPTVNRHDGGATLLKYPLRIRGILDAVRKAVPHGVPVSAKLRLGWDSHDPIYENAERAAEGGASWITIHGRTKAQGYAPPAHWEPIGKVRRSLGIPVVANGDIWTLDDFKRCRDVTGSEHFMLGRGALADPLLQVSVARELGLYSQSVDPESNWAALILRFSALSAPIPDGSRFLLGRVKQWLRMAHLRFPVPGFDEVKRAQTLEEILFRLKEIPASPFAHQ